MKNIGVSCRRLYSGQEVVEQVYEMGTFVKIGRIGRADARGHLHTLTSVRPRLIEGRVSFTKTSVFIFHICI